MKFQSVRPGERFLYEGEWFIKHTSLVAVQEVSGAQRLIPRSAPVRTVPADELAGPRTAKPANTLRAALESYHDHCLAQMRALASPVDTETREGIEQALERAYQAALSTLCD